MQVWKIIWSQKWFQRLIEMDVICLYTFLSVTKLMRKDAEPEFSLIKALNIDWAKKII